MWFFDPSGRAESRTDMAFAPLNWKFNFNPRSVDRVAPAITDFSRLAIFRDLQGPASAAVIRESLCTQFLGQNILAILWSGANFLVPKNALGNSTLGCCLI